MSRLQFKVEATSPGTRARATTFRTLHNVVQTPLFMPVGTHAVVRSQPNGHLESLGAQILLANTYHLLLRPGPEVFERFGGIHGFMKWPRSVLTDSGGFQIFCLPNDRDMTEEGASFRSYVDGKRILLSPERSIAMQRSIGSDIMMVLDECVPSTVEKARALAAMNITHRWASRSLKARGDSPQSMFAIVQGACFPDLRRESARVLTELPFDGFAIGGLAVGETMSEREDICEMTAELLPQNLPRYLMGVGTPIDLLEAVHRGVDMFDCILPGALAQQGVVFTSLGKRDLRRGVYKFVDGPLDPACTCATCTTHDVAYLHHLGKVREFLGWQLLAHHNIHFYMTLMRRMREHILAGTFLDFYRVERERLVLSDVTAPSSPPSRRPSREKPLQLGHYEVVDSPEGFSSIRHVASGEIMHSVNEPIKEALLLYVDQSGFVESASVTGDPPSSPMPPVVVWDVGLGAATNVMAAIKRYEEAAAAGKQLRPLRIVSFENDLDSLRLALQHPMKFKYLRHAGPHVLLRDGSWQSRTLDIQWSLLEGDFLDRLEEAPVPEFIFFDPFSPRTDSDMWGAACFSAIARRLSGSPVRLMTYSRSTAIRAALLGAGFHVAIGVGSGPKSETTIAFLTGMAERSPRAPVGGLRLLPADWLRRWEASQAKFPFDVPESAREAFAETIRRHPQFQN